MEAEVIKEEVGRTDVHFKCDFCDLCFYYVIVITLDAEDKKSEIESCGANLLTISKVNQMRGRGNLGNLLKSNDTLHMLYTDPCIRVVSVSMLQ